MVASLLAVGSSISWGVADFLGGFASRRIAVPAVMIVSQTTGLLLTLVAALVIEGAPTNYSVIALGLLAGVCGASALAAFFKAMSIGTMSIVAPISALGAIVPVVSGLARGDSVSALAAVGIILGVTGAVLASAEHDQQRRVTRSKGTGLALLAALGFGSFAVFIDMASNGGEIFWALTSARSSAVVVVALLAISVSISLSSVRPFLLLLIATGVVETVANCLFAEATTEGQISLVGLLGSLYPITTVLLASTVLKERISRLQWCGVVLAISGVAMISAG